MPGCIWVLTTVRVQSAKGDELRQRQPTFQRSCCVSAVTFRPVQYARFRNANCVPTLAIDRSLWLAETVTYVSGMDPLFIGSPTRTNPGTGSMRYHFFQ